MEDHVIVRLYWERDEQAILATAEKYGGYCMAIARNIVGSREDAEECVNDTWWKAWCSMPPHKPDVLATFLGKITRNLSFNRYKHNMAEKRGGGELSAVLDELSEVVSGRNTLEQEVDFRQLLCAIDSFLDSLSPEKRSIFLCRYWYTYSVSEIAARHGMREGAVSMKLNRLRRNLRVYLLERGFEL